MSNFFRADNNEVDLGGYTDGTGRKKREVEKNSDFFQTNFSDFSSNSFSDFIRREKRASENECVGKFDSAIEVIYDNDGNCQCFCGKGKEQFKYSPPTRPSV